MIRPGGKNDKEAVGSALLRLREMGIVDHRLLSAFEKVPRQKFVPVIYQEDAYNRGEFPIECGQTMTSADHVARALSALDVENSHKVLELGTGSGYQTALLSHLATKVISVERYRTLGQKAEARLKALGLKNVQFIHADGSNGAGTPELFDRIIANCCFDATPKGFLDQLSTGGVMVAPIGPGDDKQMMRKLTKVGSRFEIEDLFEVRGQPFIRGVSQTI